GHTRFSRDWSSDVCSSDLPFPYRHEAGASLPTHEMHSLAAAAARARLRDEDFARWTKGFGAIRHDDQTQLRVRRLVHEVALEREPADASADVWRLFAAADRLRSEEHTSELQSRENLVCRLLLEKKKKP